MLTQKQIHAIPPSANSVFRCHNPKGVREHKFKHGFLDSLNQVCSYQKRMKRQLISFFTVVIFQ